MKKILTVTALLFCSLIILAQINTSHSAILALNIQSDKTLYNLGESTTINGNLTLDGSLRSNALVSMEITDPLNNSYIVRVLNTSQTVTDSFPVAITQFFPSDSGGNPKYTFRVGASVNLGFKFTISNTQATNRSILAILTIVYSNNVPCELNSFIVLNATLDPLQNITRTMWPVPLTSPPLGVAHAYLNVFTNWPRNNGFALTPEKSTAFTISTTGLSGLQDFKTQEQILQLTPGTFSLSFKVNPFGGALGNYTVHATSFVMPNFASDDIRFQVYLKGDVTSNIPGVKDGVCDMKDVSTVARYFGQDVPPAPQYVDVIRDNTIDMKDISTVAKDFGKWGVLP